MLPYLEEKNPLGFDLRQKRWETDLGQRKNSPLPQTAGGSKWGIQWFSKRMKDQESKTTAKPKKAGLCSKSAKIGELETLQGWSK